MAMIVQKLNDYGRLITTSAAVFAIMFIIIKPYLKNVIQQEYENKIKSIERTQSYIMFIQLESLSIEKRREIIEKWKARNYPQK